MKQAIIFLVFLVGANCNPLTRPVVQHVSTSEIETGTPLVQIIVNLLKNSVEEVAPVLPPLVISPLPIEFPDINIRPLPIVEAPVVIETKPLPIIETKPLPIVEAPVVIETKPLPIIETRPLPIVEPVVIETKPVPSIETKPAAATPTNWADLLGYLKETYGQ